MAPGSTAWAASSAATCPRSKVVVDIPVVRPVGPGALGDGDGEQGRGEKSPHPFGKPLLPPQSRGKGERKAAAHRPRVTAAMPARPKEKGTMSSDRLYSPLSGSPRSSTPRPATKARASSRWGGLRHLPRQMTKSGVGERAERPTHRAVAAEPGARVPRRVVERQGERRPRPPGPVSERFVRPVPAMRYRWKNTSVSRMANCAIGQADRRESDGEEREAGGPLPRPVALQEGVAAEQRRDDRDPPRVGGVGVDAQAERGPGQPPTEATLGLWSDRSRANGPERPEQGGGRQRRHQGHGREHEAGAAVVEVPVRGGEGDGGEESDGATEAQPEEEVGGGDGGRAQEGHGELEGEAGRLGDPEDEGGPVSGAEGLTSDGCGVGADVAVGEDAHGLESGDRLVVVEALGHGLESEEPEEEGEGGDGGEDDPIGAVPGFDTRGGGRGGRGSAAAPGALGEHGGGIIAFFFLRGKGGEGTPASGSSPRGAGGKREKRGDGGHGGRAASLRMDSLGGGAAEGGGG